PEKYEVKIFDGRIDDERSVLKECEDAICFGVTVLTGAPIHDALRMTRRVKSRFPGLVTVWGGWHPSLFPEETLHEKAIDVVVNGQGEIPFAALLEAISSGKSFDGIKGIHSQKDGQILHAAPPPPPALNPFP